MKAAAVLFAAAIAAGDLPDVLIVERTYDGPRESAGHLARLQYTGGHLFVEWVDTTADGIFRDGFEDAP